VVGRPQAREGTPKFPSIGDEVKVAKLIKDERLRGQQEHSGILYVVCNAVPEAM
jgi:hypothetical protein